MSETVLREQINDSVYCITKNADNFVLTLQSQTVFGENVIYEIDSIGDLDSSIAFMRKFQSVVECYDNQDNSLTRNVLFFASNENLFAEPETMRELHLALLSREHNMIWSEPKDECSEAECSLTLENDKFVIEDLLTDETFVFATLADAVTKAELLCKI